MLLPPRSLGLPRVLVATNFQCQEQKGGENALFRKTCAQEASKMPRAVISLGPWLKEQGTLNILNVGMVKGVSLLPERAKGTK